MLNLPQKQLRKWAKQVCLAYFCIQSLNEELRVKREEIIINANFKLVNFGTYKNVFVSKNKVLYAKQVFAHEKFLESLKTLFSKRFSSIKKIKGDKKMKKLKFLPSVLMLAMCIAVLCVGIYAASPTSNTVKGSIMVTSMARIKITGYVNEEELFTTRNTASGIEWDLTKSTALKFDALNATSADEVPQKVIRIRIQNLSATPLGAYFYSGMGLEKQEDGSELATYASLVHEQAIYPKGIAEQNDETKLADTTLSTYTYIAKANADNDYDVINMYITIDIANLFYEEHEGEFEFNLRIEEYRSNVTTLAEASQGESEEKTLMKLPEATEDNKDEITYKIMNEDDWVVEEITEEFLTVPQISDANVGVIVIPSSYTGITAHTFKDCVSLEHLIVPYSVSIIKSEAFDNLPALISLSMPDVTEGFYDDYFGQVEYFFPELFTYMGEAENKDLFIHNVNDNSDENGDMIQRKGSIPTSLKKLYILTVSENMRFGFFEIDYGVAGEIEFYNTDIVVDALVDGQIECYSSLKGVNSVYFCSTTGANVSISW